MRKKQFRFRTLMLILSVGGILLTSLLLLSALTVFQNANIEESLLKSNVAYARKLADTTDQYLSTAQQELSYSAGLIKDLHDRARLQGEADRLRLQSGFFNSVVIVTANAVVAATSPESLKLLGVKLQSEASRQAITTQKAFISQPFISAAGNYVVFLSQPIISTDGKYLGYLGGTIYLKKKSMLSDLLGQHFYGNQADVSIVTKDGLVIFNKDPKLIGKVIDFEPLSQVRLNQEDNGYFTESQKGKQNLIGYASMQKAEWKVFISGTSDNVSRILLETIINAFWFTLFILILTTGTVIFFSGVISRPLEKLASYTRTNDSEKALMNLARLNTGYQEAEQIREAFSQHLIMMTKQVSLLSDEAMTDQLTGLYNRKGFYSRIKRHELTDEHAVIAIDIDHFKRINDRYGHEGGDSVLVNLSKMLRLLTSQDDILCRFGGEEFIIFLPNVTLEEASTAAERIRGLVENTTFPGSIKITLSAGVAELSQCGGDIKRALHCADLAMYAAKMAGRNLVFYSDPDGTHIYDKPGNDD
ncbi:sensor domain-containing diguanylate cyclase [Enterobacter sp. HG048]|uniref:sensor domain-containing diguanylate cyclase n=1 Tax=Enterobacter sp. HG048 TaxID=2969756 RepID=UPI002151F3B1|nr:sensor domain-containing diguanylate cyclase [Enterobacter sp. HG048]MCR6467859.1 sensor domain-containing diguanylate cyclase [Enterobacter sp. HG048]